MATPILIVCPECGKQVKAPENALGKKVRCKFCQAAFVARKGGGPHAERGKEGKSRSPAERSKEAKPAGAVPIKPIADDDDDNDPNPYRLVDVSLAPRCPDCANEIEEGQVICLHCGYNMRTRTKAKTRKVYDVTFGQHFLWLLPGIACALSVFGIIGFNVWYLMKINDLVDENSSFFAWIWSVGGIKLWVVIMSIGLVWLAGKFAVKRLIFHPKPPEIEKLK